MAAPLPTRALRLGVAAVAGVDGCSAGHWLHLHARQRVVSHESHLIVQSGRAMAHAWIETLPHAACRPTFEGTGRRLGGASSSSAAPPAQLGHPVTAWSGPDDSKPVTSVQLRFPDGSRLVGRFNHDQAVREIRSFVAAARPHDSNAYVMLTGFPAKQIEDESQTIADAGLINAVVTFKKA